MAQLITILLATVVLLSSVAAANTVLLPPRIASGDISSTGAVIWGQVDATAAMQVEYSLDPNFIDSKKVQGPMVDESSDFSGQVELQHLSPARRYFYRILFRNHQPHTEPQRDGPSITSGTGTFQTAPISATPAPVSFVFSGDLGGQGYCRHTADGYRIFSAMFERSPDFFIASGDFIYADSTCPAQGPAGWSNVPGVFASISDANVDWMDRSAVRTTYRDHWRYQFEDDTFPNFSVTSLSIRNGTIMK
jgi:phosphodiesterase/alkaline phosphatase D-like protein